MDNIDASIIILAKNAGQNFSRLLDRIFSQGFDGKYEVMVIDTGSRDDTLEIAARFPVMITEIRPNEFHHGKTRNLGCGLSQGKIIVNITQDALPYDNRWLQKLVDNFAEPQVAMVSGRQIPWRTTKPPEKFYYAYNFPTFKIAVSQGASDYYHDNIFISNVNSAIRKDVWQQFKFSEDILMGEDKEFAKRVLLGGWSIVYEPEAAVYHAHDYSVRSVFQRSVDYGVSARLGAGGLPRSRGSLVRRAFERFGAEIKYLNDTGCLRWLPYSAIYEVSRYTGLVLGNLGIIKRSHWQQQTRSIRSQDVAV